MLFSGRTALAVFLVCLGACRPAAPVPEVKGQSVRQRIAALALGRAEFGAVSLIPVRFEHSRIGGPFEDGGRTLYCVSTQMKGRTFDKPERPKIVIREEKGVLQLIDDEDVCTGHRTEPFTELDTPTAKGT